jgi:jumonji domain-containing protein 7
MRESTVARVDVADVADFRELERGGRPLLVTGAQKEWAAPSRWSPDYLRDAIGDVTAPVEFYPDGSYFGPWTRVDMRVRGYLDLISGRDPERCYLAQVPLVDLFPALVPDIAVPPLLVPVRRLGAALFIGRDTVTALHYHSGSQALLCAVSGTKRVTLFPPEDHRVLRYERWYSYRFNFSRIPVGPQRSGGQPPPDRSHPYQCEVGPGEALFIPLYWGHLVEGVGFTTSVTFFWDASVSGWHQPRVKAIATLGGLTRRWVAAPLVKAVERTVGLPD